MATLIVDTGINLVGVFSVEENSYVPYRDDGIQTAIRLIQVADEVVTFNGNNYDLEKLGAFAGLVGDLPLNGVHSDMRSICWSDRIWGSDLPGTYYRHYTECPAFPDTHEGSTERDCYMTFKLWELWKQGTLKVIDGYSK
ncbi:MAG: hypothetical protein BGO25_03185 [Acidobacteriales bacterium 59-55]|nr:hypothetical protein [Terriglobales bacterium]OJV40167.1 MAG: hypothetical protein BGO25_03185 [Acidobacteriales bacterium 59-55]